MPHLKEQKEKSKKIIAQRRLRNQNRSLDYALILTSISLLLITASIDYFYPNSIYWFQRTGSIVVVAMLIIEYRYHLLASSVPSKVYYEKSIPLQVGFKVGWLRKRIHIVSLSIGFTGTLIWAFGDLPFKLWLSIPN